jgi:hypothetical protein
MPPLKHVNMVVRHVTMVVGYEVNSNSFCLCPCKKTHGSLQTKHGESFFYGKIKGVLAKRICSFICFRPYLKYFYIGAIAAGITIIHGGRSGI